MELSNVSLSASGRIVPTGEPNNRGIATNNWFTSLFTKTVKTQIGGKTKRFNVDSSFKFVTPKEKLPTGATKEQRKAAKQAHAKAREDFLKLNPEEILAIVQERVNAINKSKESETPPEAPPPVDLPETPPPIRRLAESSNEGISPDFTAETLRPVTRLGKPLEDPDIKNFLASIETTAPELHGVLMPLMEEQNTLRITQLGPSLAIPNTEALKSIADKYADKYDVNIKIVSLPMAKETPPSIEDEDAYYDYITSRDRVFEEHLNNTKELLASEIKKEQQDKTPRSIGMIFDVDGESHVVPLLLKIENEEAKVLVLDILGYAASCNGINRAVISVLKELQIPFSRCWDQRQADARSCRIGSIITLRNALLTLKENQEAALQPFQKCTYPDDESFRLPPAWGGANDQIFRPEESADEILNPRQAYSKVPDKHIETVKESRQRHRVEIPFQFELTFSHDTADLAEIKLPEGVNLKILSDGKFMIQWSAFKQVNGYMLMKGRKEAGLGTV